METLSFWKNRKEPIHLYTSTKLFIEFFLQLKVGTRDKDENTDLSNLGRGTFNKADKY